MSNSLRSINSHLGNGITFPLRRSGGDFEHTSGPDLVMSSIPFILLTNADGGNVQGDLPWDTGFGSQLLRMKFSGLEGEALRTFTEHWVVEALFLNEPRVLVIDVETEKVDRSVSVRITLRMIDEDTEGNNVRSYDASTVTVNLPF